MIILEKVVRYFGQRAPDYDASSRWCTDEALTRRLVDLLKPAAADVVLDIACGTGLVARALRPHVAEIVGVDITPAMLNQARPYLDAALLANAELLPLDNDQFDLVTCRQGIQFLDAPRAVAEMVRVARPGGKICLINLCAYGDDDCAEFFEILHLRNPVRRNYFLREDLVQLLRNAGCKHVALDDHVSIEDIDVWAGKAAIDDADKEIIRMLYLHASPAFQRLHRVEQDAAGRIRDHMLFGIAIGTKGP